MRWERLMQQGMKCVSGNSCIQSLVSNSLLIVFLLENHVHWRTRDERWGQKMRKRTTGIVVGRRLFLTQSLREKFQREIQEERRLLLVFNRTQNTKSCCHEIVPFILIPRETTTLTTSSFFLSFHREQNRLTRDSFLFSIPVHPQVFRFLSSDCEEWFDARGSWSWSLPFIPLSFSVSPVSEWNLILFLSCVSSPECCSLLSTK